jgi:integrase/recombinase XerD
MSRSPPHDRGHDLSDKTQRDYIRQIEAFASFLGRSPDTATGDDIRRFRKRRRSLALPCLT